MIVASISFFCVWDEPATANFLTEHEKEALLGALQPARIAPSTNPQLGHGHSFKWKQVMAALVDWQVCISVLTSSKSQLTRCIADHLSLFGVLGNG